MNPLQVNKETGFIESVNPSGTGFNSDKKRLFLELALEQARLGIYPQIIKLCKQVDVYPKTFYFHRDHDPVFKERWDIVMREIEGLLVQVMVDNGQKPSGYMDRITWLRKHFKEWNPETIHQIQSDNVPNKNVIDALVVDIDPNIEELTPIKGNNQELIESKPPESVKQIDTQSQIFEDNSGVITNHNADYRKQTPKDNDTQ